jgi:hypothetical protein
MEPPAPNLLPDPLRRSGTDGGRKAHKQLPVSITDQAGPETVPQEIKFLADLSRLLFADVTTNNPGFLRMKLKLAFLKTPFQAFLKVARLGFASTVHHTVIRVAGKWIVRKVPLHPLVKHIVQKEVREYGTDNATLRGTVDPFYEPSIRLCIFCPIPITDSGLNRSSILEHSDH